MGRWRRGEEPLFFGSAATLLLIASLLPLALLAAQLFWSGEGLAQQLGATLGAGRTWALLAQTLGLALAVTALALTIGVPLGVLLGKTDVLGRRAALVLHAFPFFVPPFLVALGTFDLIGAGGPLGSAASSALLFSPLGVIALLGLVFSPVVTGLTLLGLRGVRPSLEEAAQVLSSPWRVVTRISLPLSGPAIALAALIVLSLSLSEIGVPMFLRVDTYAAAVFSRLGGISYAPGEAFALVLPLLVIALGLLLIERRLIGRRALSALGALDRGGARWSLGRWRLPVSAGVWTLSALSLAPIIALATRAWPEGYASLGQWLGGSISNSFEVALWAATLITGLGIVLGHALSHRRRGSGTLDGVALFAFVTPAAVLGVGLVATWNHEATALVYSTTAIMVIALVARYAIVGLRTVAATLSRTPPSAEEAAAAFGAGYWRRLSRIVVPMHARGLGAAWLLALVFCLRDLETVVVFYPPGRETLPIRIFTLEANGAPEVVAALATTHIAITAGALLLGGLLLWTWRRP